MLPQSTQWNRRSLCQSSRRWHSCVTYWGWGKTRRLLVHTLMAVKAKLRHEEFSCWAIILSTGEVGRCWRSNLYCQASCCVVKWAVWTWCAASWQNSPSRLVSIPGHQWSEHTSGFLNEARTHGIHKCPITDYFQPPLHKNSHFQMVCGSTQAETFDCIFQISDEACTRLGRPSSKCVQTDAFPLFRQPN